MYNKTKIFNLALQALFIKKRISDAESDNSTEAHTMNVQWDFIYPVALSELDLNSTVKTKALELIVERPDRQWMYAYKYPSNAALVRKIDHLERIRDNYDTLIPHETKLLDYQETTYRAIFTDKCEAHVQYIPTDLSPEHLTPEAANYIAYKLAQACISLIIGENSKTVSDRVEKGLIEWHIAAKRRDSIENHVYEKITDRSKFARVRMS